MICLSLEMNEDELNAELIHLGGFKAHQRVSLQGSHEAGTGVRNQPLLAGMRNQALLGEKGGPGIQILFWQDWAHLQVSSFSCLSSTSIKSSWEHSSHPQIQLAQERGQS